MTPDTRRQTGHSVAPPSAAEADVQALVDLVGVIESTQRTEDVDGFLALFAPDAVWVTGGGRRLVGADVIGAFTRSVLPGAMAAGSVEYVVEHVSLISPDVALTGVRQQYTDLDGNPVDDGAGLPSYVWRRSGDSWRIVAGQNTAVPS